MLSLLGKNIKLCRVDENIMTVGKKARGEENGNFWEGNQDLSIWTRRGEENEVLGNFIHPCYVWDIPSNLRKSRLHNSLDFNAYATITFRKCWKLEILNLIVIFPLLSSEDTFETRNTRSSVHRNYDFTFRPTIAKYIITIREAAEKRIFFF